LADVAFFGGIKVVDFSRALAGPFCTMMLADLGAEVVKVEPPPSGDESRLWGPPFIGGESAYFLSINRGKKSIVVDLSKPEGREVAARLLQEADVVVENFRPGTAKKLGIDYDSVRVKNPGVIYCSISGFGQTGPYRELPGYDIIAFALSGMMSITGEEGRPPVKMAVPVSDIGAGMYAAFAISASLFRRAGTGLGEYIDVSLLEGQISWLTYQAGFFFSQGQEPRRLGSAHLTIAPYQVFRSRDGYFVVAAGNDEHWSRLCEAIGASGLKGDKRFSTNPDRVKNREALEDELNAIFAQDTSEAWVTKISVAGVPCCLIHNLSQVFSDKHVLERGVIREVHHPKAGSLKQLAPPYRFLNYTTKIILPPPVLGEHTEEVLSSIGYPPEAVTRLRSLGAVA
jgi:crotonobetainyl-CoA:carnitine CoA-transferase CaiB-like acyl-CoA transferase